MTVLSTIHGLPRIGPRRELKHALEAYWAGLATADELARTAQQIRGGNWRLMRAVGIDLIPSGDFSLYDHVLDTAVMVGAVAKRHRPAAGPVDLDASFAMARGGSVPALAMTKWFDTNYHHLVPELGPDDTPALAAGPLLDQIAEARGLGIETKPVLLGPVSLLLLSRAAADAPPSFRPLELLEPMLDVYSELLVTLGGAGVAWVQLEEPCFAEDRTPAELAALARAAERLGRLADRPRLGVSIAYGDAGDALGVLADAPVDAVGLDFARGRRNLELLEGIGGLRGKALFAGVVDGRNVWINDLAASLELLERLAGRCEDLVVSTSCSLMHVPVDLDAESWLDPGLRPWMAFARQKVHEVATLTRGLVEGTPAIADELGANARALAARAAAPRTHDARLRARLAAVAGDDAGARPDPYDERTGAQQERLDLPVLPTTTVGSFPQTPQVRATRAAWELGELSDGEYRTRMHAEIERVVRLQEDLGIDVLVHGEPERSDMVRYFAENLEGFALTERGWVQSYGSRCVRPPVIVGDVVRRAPITVDWARHAQSLTDRPVKGMLTGPVTMLQWSFARDDQPREATGMQLALAVRDEVADLQDAGIAIIQVDEPAIREGLPLRQAEREAYLEWAVGAFRLATGSARADTQIQTHMCYSDFAGIVGQLDAMDADVLLIEAARSRMELLDVWRDADHQRQIGPGVYDIHAVRVPSAGEMAALLERAVEALGAERVWVVPDCGLKTRRYAEVEPALRNLVAAARRVRQECAAGELLGAA